MRTGVAMDGIAVTRWCKWATLSLIHLWAPETLMVALCQLWASREELK